MAKTLSQMLELGTKAPAFTLPDAEGKLVSLAESSKDAKGILVMFLCNHCPYVVHVIKTLSSVCRQLQQQGIAVIAINANDTQRYPEDSPEKMIDFAKKYQLSFPYLFDASQQVAKAYRAACTPDFFLFDQNHKLFYRGQMDGSRPGSQEPCDGKDLRAAAAALLANKDKHSPQLPSIGCNIKWKEGQAPSYYSP